MLCDFGAGDAAASATAGFVLGKFAGAVSAAFKAGGDTGDAGVADALLASEVELAETVPAESFPDGEVRVDDAFPTARDDAGELEGTGAVTGAEGPNCRAAMSWSGSGPPLTRCSMS